MSNLASKQRGLCSNKPGLSSEFHNDCFMTLKTLGFYFLSYKYNRNLGLSFSGFPPFGAGAGGKVLGTAGGWPETLQPRHSPAHSVPGHLLESRGCHLLLNNGYHTGLAWSEDSSFQPCYHGFHVSISPSLNFPQHSYLRPSHLKSWRKQGKWQ